MNGTELIKWAVNQCGLNNLPPLDCNVLMFIREHKNDEEAERGFFGYSREEKEVMAEHEQNQHEQWVEKQLRTDFDKWAATVKNIERLSPWAIWKAAKTK